jgi:hypothetical protein
MGKLAVREALWILLGIAVLMVLMGLGDTSEPALPRCPAHQTTSTRCAP